MEREKDLRRQGEALAAATASRWDDALPPVCDRAGCDAANSVGAGGNGRCIPDVSADAAADGHQERTKWQHRSLLEENLTRSQVGWLDLLFRGMVSIPG